MRAPRPSAAGPAVEARAAALVEASPPSRAALSRAAPASSRRLPSRDARRQPLVLANDCAYGRLLAHGVCQFYGLHALSADLPAGRCVVASWSSGEERARRGAAVSVVRTAAACAAQAGGGGCALVGLAEEEEDR